ncbi:MAG: hypothetical protein ACLUYZ_01405 [Lachnospiraceae bacterium]
MSDELNMSFATLSIRAGDLAGKRKYSEESLLRLRQKSRIDHRHHRCGVGVLAYAGCRVATNAPFTWRFLAILRVG